MTLPEYTTLNVENNPLVLHIDADQTVNKESATYECTFFNAFVNGGIVKYVDFDEVEKEAHVIGHYYGFFKVNGIWYQIEDENEPQSMILKRLKARLKKLKSSISLKLSKSDF